MRIVGMFRIFISSNFRPFSQYLCNIDKPEYYHLFITSLLGTMAEQVKRNARVRKPPSRLRDDQDEILFHPPNAQTPSKANKQKTEAKTLTELARILSKFINKSNKNRLELIAKAKQISLLQEQTLTPISQNIEQPKTPQNHPQPVKAESPKKILEKPPVGFQKIQVSINSIENPIKIQNKPQAETQLPKKTGIQNGYSIEQRSSFGLELKEKLTQQKNRQKPAHQKKEPSKNESLRCFQKVIDSTQSTETIFKRQTFHIATAYRIHYNNTRDAYPDLNLYILDPIRLSRSVKEKMAKQFQHQNDIEKILYCRNSQHRQGDRDCACIICWQERKEKNLKMIRQQALKEYLEENVQPKLNGKNKQTK